jgi:hypothetical protein
MLANFYRTASRYIPEVVIALATSNPTFLKIRLVIAENQENICRGGLLQDIPGVLARSPPNKSAVASVVSEN